jgi:ATP-binding protein involved in chromosome partitioning
MSYSQQQIFDALKKVIHPAKKMDIVSLEMVEDLNITGKEIHFSLLFPKSNDPFASSIKKACVKTILAHVDPGADINGNITIKSPKKEPKREMLPDVKNIIAIASGKGGVGKSTIAVNLAVSMVKKGLRVGLIDADIFGPSIPKMFNAVKAKPLVNRVDGVDIIVPVESYGVKLLSIGFFVDPDDALVWRGPMATNALKQMIGQSDWGELDYILVDLPPGTSDIHLTLVQEVPVTGAIIVSTPQEVALADAVKGISMFSADQIHVPILGLVENMAWFTPAELPENRYYIFGKNGCERLAKKYNVPLLGQIPIVESICEDGDQGNPSALDEKSPTGKAFLELAENVMKQVDIRNRELEPTKIVEIKSGK